MAAKISILKVIDMVPFGYGGDVGRFYALRLSRPNWEAWHPGQYVMLRPVSWGMEMPWPRPFSICMLGKNDLVLFFQVVGRGTERLLKLKTDDEVQVVGPLGSSFIMEQETPTLLLAGGMGIAPFVGYVQTHPTPWALHLDFGHRLPLGCYPFENFNERITADNYHERSPQDQKQFLELLDKKIQDYTAQNGLVLACGPMPFLQAIQKMCIRHSARAQLSLETKMACGIGACLGCVVSPLLDQAGRNISSNPLPPELESGQPVPVCTCGPVFWADAVNLEEAK